MNKPKAFMKAKTDDPMKTREQDFNKTRSAKSRCFILFNKNYTSQSLKVANTNQSS